MIKGIERIQNTKAVKKAAEKNAARKKAAFLFQRKKRALFCQGSVMLDVAATGLIAVNTVLPVTKSS
jgi:hypothetical protein